MKQHRGAAKERQYAHMAELAMAVDLPTPTVSPPASPPALTPLPVVTTIKGNGMIIPAPTFYPKTSLAAICYGTALIFHFFLLFGLVDIIIRFKGEHMVNTCCSTTHGFLMFDCAPHGYHM